MKRSLIIMISGGIILLSGFIILAIVAQSAISEIRKKEYTLGPREVLTIKERIDSSQFFSGVYAVEVLDPGDSSVRIEVRDPDGIQIISKKLDTPFLIDSFDVKKDGLYVMSIENSSPRDLLRVAAALGGEVYAGTSDPMITVAMPTYIAIAGIIILIAGAVVYYKERRFGAL
ncbi:MAG: hypothetical protein ACE5KA_01440 [Nitrososphaerales archaeon]